MATAASLNITLGGYVEDGEEVYHDIVLHEGVRYDIELEPEDEDVDLDLYITDGENNVLFEDEREDAGATMWFEPASYGIYRFFVKSHEGETDYELFVSE